MDDLDLAVLEAEANEDLRVAAQASRLARERFGKGADAELEACAYQLARFYNIVEQLALRIAKTFENRIDDDSGWHVELVRRMSLDIPGVRPPLFSTEIIPDLQELHAFRHVVRHAYDMSLRKEKMLPVLQAAERAVQRLPGLCEKFFAKIRSQLGT